MKRKNFKIAIIGISVLLILLIAGIVYIKAIMNTDKIYDNVYINDVDVSKMTVEEAETVLNERFKFGDLVLKKEDVELTQDLSQVGFSYDISESVKKAYGIGRNGSFFGDIFQFIGLKIGKKENIALETKESFDKLDKFYEEVSQKVNRPAKNASISIEGQGIVVIDSETGFELDLEKLKSDVQTAIKQAENKSLIEVTIPVTETQPKIKTEELKQINGLIASYSSEYIQSNVERSYNVALAANKVNNQLIMPGEEVSFMDTLGHVSQQNGFKISKIIVNNEFQDGVGGGVCQVSSTLYNALLMSGVGITSRTNHTFPIIYIPTGRDATVANDGPDLKYKNNYDFPVFIKNYAYNGHMVSEVYGNVEKAKRYDIQSEITSSTPPNVVYKNDNTIEKGKEVVEDNGHTGYTAVSYRVLNGEKTIISRDTYAMTPKIVKVGTKEVKDEKKTDNQNAVQASQSVSPANATSDTNVVF